MKLSIFTFSLIATVLSNLLPTVLGFTQQRLQRALINKKSIISTTAINMVQTRGLEKREEGATPLRKLSKRIKTLQYFCFCFGLKDHSFFFLIFLLFIVLYSWRDDTLHQSRS